MNVAFIEYLPEIVELCMCEATKLINNHVSRVVGHDRHDTQILLFALDCLLAGTRCYENTLYATISRICIASVV